MWILVGVCGLGLLAASFFVIQFSQSASDGVRTDISSPPAVASRSLDTVPTLPEPTITPASRVALKATSDLTGSVGVYEGPGNVDAHTTFEQWLERSVPYATDYIDFKGGWQKDFIDAKAWLADHWGPWVQADARRRLVLGLPILENSATGQFDRAAAGDFDKYFGGLATDLVAAQLSNSIIRLGYEANCNTIGPWQATDNPTGYKNAFRHIVSVMRSVAGASFKFDWTVCNGLQNGHTLSSFDDFYPGDDVVDSIGMDIYDIKWGDASATAAQRWEYMNNRTLGIQDFLHFADAHQKPVSYPEWGLYKPGDQLAGGGDDPSFVIYMHDLIVQTHPLYQSYFDIDWGGGRLLDFPGAAATLRYYFSQ